MAEERKIAVVLWKTRMKTTMNLLSVFLSLVFHFACFKKWWFSHFSPAADHPIQQTIEAASQWARHAAFTASRAAQAAQYASQQAQYVMESTAPAVAIGGLVWQFGLTV